MLSRAELSERFLSGRPTLPSSSASTLTAPELWGGVRWVLRGRDLCAAGRAGRQDLWPGRGSVHRLQ